MSAQTGPQATSLKLREWPHRYTKTRFDYFLIWGNGTAHFNGIVDLIERTPDFEISKVIKHSPHSITDLVNAVYAYDYAPIEHLRAKTEYLLKSKPEVIFIFCKNSNAEETYMGRERFRHIECLRVKKLKESIRDTFNPRIDGKRTEEHVIHASDNELQTDYILKYLGYGSGVEYIKHCPNLVLRAPCHLPAFNNFFITLAAAEQIRCRILTGTRDSFSHAVIPLNETPHYLALKGDPSLYEDYILEFGGFQLKDNHNIRRLSELGKSISYLTGPHRGQYILTKEMDGTYVIVDGVHRASALLASGVESFLVGVIQ